MQTCPTAHLQNQMLGTVGPGTHVSSKVPSGEARIEQSGASVLADGQEPADG